MGGFPKGLKRAWAESRNEARCIALDARSREAEPLLERRLWGTAFAYWIRHAGNPLSRWAEIVRRPAIGPGSSPRLGIHARTPLTGSDLAVLAAFQESRTVTGPCCGRVMCGLGIW